MKKAPVKQSGTIVGQQKKKCPIQITYQYVVTNLSTLQCLKNAQKLKMLRWLNTAKAIYPQNTVAVMQSKSNQTATFIIY